MTPRDKFYVLGIDSVKSWVLQLEGFTSKELAERAVHWQQVGQGEFSRWAICKFVPVAGGRFKCITNDTLYKPEGGIYTMQAWAGFLGGLFP